MADTKVKVTSVGMDFNTKALEIAASMVRDSVSTPVDQEQRLEQTKEIYKLWYMLV